MWNETGKYGPYTGKNKSIETFFWGSSDVGFTRKDFKSAIINTFKELKETMPKELKEEKKNRIEGMYKSNSTPKRKYQ